MSEEDYYSRRQRKSDSQFMAFLGWVMLPLLALLTVVSLVRYFIIVFL
jgi:hypothetical protein